MARMYLMCGCSGAGKTTFSKEFAKEHNLLYLGVDDFYQKVNGDECLHINSFEVWIEFFKAIHEAEVNNIDCIIDTNAITRVHRGQFIEWFPTFEHHLIYIRTEVALRKMNNLSRRRKVPDSEMDKMTERLEVPYPTLEDPAWKTICLINNKYNSFDAPVFLKGDNWE